MPQADILTFQPTLLFLPFIFLVGYFLFLTLWVPRIILTLKSRAYLLNLTFLVPSEEWPEIFLLFLQFGGLVYLLTTFSLVDRKYQLSGLVFCPSSYLSSSALGAQKLANFFYLWVKHRQTLYYTFTFYELTSFIFRLLSGFSYHVASKQFPLILNRIKKLLPSSFGDGDSKS